MSELITTLHPHDDNSVDIYPNIKLENIIDGKSEDAGKFVKVDEDGRFVVETVNIPEPPQVNNSTITIKQGGVDKGSFTLNQAEDTTIELDAGGGTGESGSSIYATTSAISKGTPAHIEAVNPIRVGDTISQLYFNTNQAIKSYLENCVNWSDGNKVQETGGICAYTLLSALSDENSLGFRSLKVGDYIKCLKIKSDFEPGDSKVDSELNSWLANILSSNSSVTLLNVTNSNGSYEALRAYTSDNSTYELQLKSSQSSDWSTMYSSTSGYSYNNYNSEEHAYNVTNSSKEVQIETINESTGWNGVFFGAISDIGEPLLTAFLYPENLEYYIIENTYFLGKSMFAINESGVDAVYYSSGLIPMDTPIKAGWHVEAGQSITLDSPEKAKVVNDAVSKIAANDNSWVNVDEILGSIYQDKILGTDEVKVNDILIDTEGLFGKVKELSEESIKNQHPENPFIVGEEINSDSVLYFDTSIIPDVSKFDWSSAIDNEGQTMLMLASPLPLIAVQMSPFAIYDSFGVKINNPIYLFGVEGDGSGILYLQVDPSDMDTLASTYLTEEFPIEAWNNWTVQGQFEHEGSIYKVPAGLEETSTISSLISKDIWGACVTKDGKWIEDTPTLKTKVSCESLRQLPTDYRNISGTPIITINGFLEGDFIKTNYVNKYIQDSTGIIYFCDGENVHELTGGSGSSSSFNGNSINLNPSHGLKSYVYSSSDNNYSNEFGLTDNQLGGYSQSDGDQVFGKRSGDYGWIDLPSQSGTQIQAGSGIEVSGNTVSLTSTTGGGVIDATGSVGINVLSKSTASGSIGWSAISIPRTVGAGTGISIERGSNSDAINLSQDTQNKLNGALQGVSSISNLGASEQGEVYLTYAVDDINEAFNLNHVKMVRTTASSSSTENYTAGNGIAFTPVENSTTISLDNDTQTKLSNMLTAQDDLITNLVHSTADNEAAILKKYTKPDSGIPASDLSSEVQDSLTKANSALQENALVGYATTSQVNAKYTKPEDGIPKSDLTSSVQSSLTKADSSISGVKVNGQQVAVTDGIVDIGTVITEHQSLDGKQDKLNTEQLAAVNSGITAAKISTYDGYATSIQTLNTNLNESDTEIAQNSADISTLKTTVAAKYTKPESGIPGSDLSTDVQSALTKANNALTSIPDTVMTTDTEQIITGKKSFNSGLSSSSTGSNGIQTSIDMGAGSDLKLEQEKSGAKVGIQFSTTNKQLSIYNISGETEHRLDFDDDGVKYGESEIATKADLNAKVANSNVIESKDYDNTTLKAHIDEILGYVNSENGGTLVSIGFKVGTEGASTAITNLHMSSDNTISIDTETDVILGAGSYYYAYPEQVVTSGVNEGVFFTCRNGFTLGRGILYITDAGTKEAKLTGESTVITSATQITKMMFQDVDVSEVALEHLTLNFYKFNTAD